VLALQFDRPAIDLEVLGLLAGRLKADFPTQQQQPPLPPMQEATGQPGPPQFEVQFGAMPMPRTWFSSPDGHRLVQVQSDRLVLNWRRLEGDEPYPRYVFLRDLLSQLLGKLTEVFEAAKTEVPAVNFSELSYINEIAVPGVGPGQPHPDLAQIIEFVERLAGRTFLPQAEDAQFQARWRIPKDQLPDGSAIGRLYVVLSPGFRADTQLPIYVMNMTTRIVPPPTSNFDMALELLDIGHDWIVRGFADLTTEDMHRYWQVRT
jgi:uncharacterized protein (TIGR04255 family)